MKNLIVGSIWIAGGVLVIIYREQLVRYLVQYRNKYMGHSLGERTIKFGIMFGIFFGLVAILMGALIMLGLDDSLGLTTK